MSRADLELARDIAQYTHDPYGYARYAFPWGVARTPLEHESIRTWQADELRAIGEHLRNPATRHTPYESAVASGHGIGKSALISMIVKWAMDTCEDCRVVVTANTEQQLRTKTWPEVTKWQNLAITKHWFEVGATSITSRQSGHEKAWRVDAVTWSETNTEAFAGLHNKRKRIVVIMDESSAIADKVWEVAEGALTDEGTEIIWLAFGNPTRNTGRFKDCFGRLRHRWRTRHIDSRTVEGTNKQQLDQFVTDNGGEDSDIVKVRVRGLFPSQSIAQFIGEDLVAAAYGRHLRTDQYDWAPKIITLDRAWEGDDEWVIGCRQGLAYRMLERGPRNSNDVLLANKLARYEDEEGADAVFVDGGYGTGVVSVGRTLGRDWIIVWFSEHSNDPACLNKRAEMWNAMRTWLREGGAIPADPVLRDDLLGPEVKPRLDGKIVLESKQDMKARGQASPNRADALALSFAHPVAKKHPAPQDTLAAMVQDARQRAATEYDPYDPKRW